MRSHSDSTYGDPVKTFSPTVFEAAGAIELSDVKAVASYSWIDAKTPTIAVPGTQILQESELKY
jgi:hypothetical protein